MSEPVTRRSFLWLALATGAVAVAGTSGPSSAAPAAVPDPWRAEVFRPLLGQRLPVSTGGALRVVRVDDRGSADGERFTVVLDPEGVDPSASLFTVRHPAVGTLLLAATATGDLGHLHAVVDQRRPRTPLER